MAEADRAVSLNAALRNARDLVRITQLHVLRLVEEAAKHGVPLAKLKRAIKDGDREFLDRHFWFAMLEFDVALVSHRTLTDSSLSIGRESDNPPATGKEAEKTAGV